VDCLLELADGESLAALVAASVRSAVPPPVIRGIFVEAYPQVLAQLGATSTAVVEPAVE
jgi:hypothetical protein